MATRLLARPFRLVLVPAAAVAAALGVLPASVGQAAPAPSITTVQARIDALNTQADRAVEAYDAATVAMAATAHKAAAAKSRVSSASAQLAALQRQMGEFAAAAYRTGSSDELLALFTSGSPQRFLEQASSLEQLARSQRDQVDAVRVAHHDLAQAQSDAAEQLAAERAIQRRLAAQKKAVEGALAEQQALLSHLRADQRRALAAAQARREAADRARAAAAKASVFSSAGYTGPASGRAGAAVRYAYSQLGKPYKWGADGPGSFDCSGLTMEAWRHGGVYLPHSSQAQYSYGQHVSLSHLAPGDLIFYGSPIHHVSIYVGNGQAIDAPHSGAVVRVTTAIRRDTVGATRP